MAAAVIWVLAAGTGLRAAASPGRGARLLQASITAQNSVIGKTTHYISATLLLDGSTERSTELTPRARRSRDHVEEAIDLEEEA